MSAAVAAPSSRSPPCPRSATRADVRRQVAAGRRPSRSSALVLLLVLALDIDDRDAQFTLDDALTEDNLPHRSTARAGAAVAGLRRAGARAGRGGPPGPPRCTGGAAGLGGRRRRLRRSGSSSGPPPTRTSPFPRRQPAAGTLTLATPLVFGALAGSSCERAGVINVAIEGQFLAAAFAAAVVGSALLQRRDRPGRRRSSPASRSPRCWRVFAIKLPVNQVVLGVVLIAARHRPDQLPAPTRSPSTPTPGTSTTRRSWRRSRSRGWPTSRSSVRAVRPDPARLPDVRPRRRWSTVLLFQTVGPARPLGRRAPEGRGHGRHQGQPDPLAGACCSVVSSPASAAPFFTVGSTGPSTRTSRPERVHRAGRGDHGPLAPGLAPRSPRCSSASWTPRASWPSADASSLPAAAARLPYLATIIAVAGLRRSGPPAGRRRRALQKS